MRRPDISERVAKANNYNEERKKKEHDRVQQLLSDRREYEEILEWKERMKFDLFLTADIILEKLEEQRDANEPKTSDEPWNEQFCEAIRLIPIAREFAQQCFAECLKES